MIFFKIGNVMCRFHDVVSSCIFCVSYVAKHKNMIRIFNNVRVQKSYFSIYLWNIRNVDLIGGTLGMWNLFTC